jgi:hypothetical protein
MRSHGITLVLIMCVALIFVACKDDGPTGTSDAPALPLFTATILNPITTSGPNEAVTTSSYISMAAGHARAAWLDPFVGLTGTVKGDTTRWTLTTGILTKTLWAAPLTDSTVAWGLVYNGSDSAGTYTNWTRILGNTLNKRTWEHWYDYGSPTATHYTFVHIVKSSSSVTSVFVTDHSLLGSPGAYWQVTGNTDGSGKLTYTSDVTSPGSPYFRAVWLIDGSGMWQRGSRDGISGGGMW